MVDRLVVDVDADGTASVLTGGDLPEVVSSGLAVRRSLTDTELEDLRWYLEDYLRAPYGVFAHRGEEIARRLSGWGQSMFTDVFGAGPARDAYVRLRARDGTRDAVEIVVRSSSPDWLGLPWELMADPDRPTPLVLDGVSLSRSLRTTTIGTPFEVDGERLRVLMVISRPRGEADVGYRMIARHLLKRLDLVAGKVELVVLRPPTFDALRGTLLGAREAGNPFQIVHFDGHGELTGGRLAANAPDNYAQAGTGIGVLVFEDLGGGEDQVSADRIAQILADAQVPVVVLNACQSGAVGKQLEAAIATRLLAGGASAVVAMAYTVYAVAAAEFMTAFYDRLFTGATVSESVTAGRARMRQQPNRPSPKGKVPLQDWLIPVHYLRKEIRFPHLHQQPQARPPGISLGDALSALETDDTLHPAGNADALTAVDEFVGRDGLFYTIEVAARTQHVIVLHGLGGTGKTELAKAFGRWWQRTDGVDDPDWVIWHSFEPGVASFGLDGVLDEIGLQLLGTDFVRTEPTRRRPLIQRLLQQHRLLVILDNFETVRTMPDPTSATPALDESGLIELQQFLENIAADSRSTVLITSRTPEHWLGPHIRRVPVGGLTPEEADTYTDQLFAPFPAARPRRSHPDYPALLEWLDGHPLAMRLTLPHLDHTSPDQLLANLQGILTEDDDEPETGADRRSSLTASIGYSLSHLDTTDQQLVQVVGLFRGVADADVLNNFSSAEHTPHRFRGIDVDRWAAILDRATDLGMLTDIGAGIYLIHPALPAQLIRHWRTQHPDTFDAEYADTQGALLETFAYFGGWLDREIDSGDTARAYEFVNHHRRNLGYYLGYALNHQHWLEAQAIALPLYSYWERSGRGEEAETWTDRLLNCLEAADGSPPPLDQPNGYLWLFATNQVGERQLWAHQLDEAESTFRRIHEMLKQLPDTRRTQLRLQATYQRLGMVARERPQYDAAQKWYNKALAISHKLGSQTSIASAYRLLGGLARDRRRYDDAERWYHKALKISAQRRDDSAFASIYHQLGFIEKERGETYYNLALQSRNDSTDGPALLMYDALTHFGAADQWYRKSLAIRERLRDQPGLAKSYHELGTIALMLLDLDAAKDWYRKALTINERLRNQHGAAMTYHQLGSVAQMKQQYDDAEAWFQEAHAVFKRLNDHKRLAGSYTQLSGLAEQRGDTALAFERIVHSLTIFHEFPHPATGPAPTYLAGLTARHGIAPLERAWIKVTGMALPQHVREFISNHNDTETQQEDQ